MHLVQIYQILTDILLGLGFWSVRLNGEQLRENGKLARSGVTVQLRRMSHKNLAVEVLTPLYNVKVLGKEQHDVQHLDFQVDLAGKAIAPGGLLGVTIPGFNQNIHPAEMTKTQIIEHFSV